MEQGTGICPMTIIRYIFLLHLAGEDLDAFCYSAMDDGQCALRMCFSLDLINFSGAQGLYRGRTCERVNVGMCECVCPGLLHVTVLT